MERDDYFSPQQPISAASTVPPDAPLPLPLLEEVDPETQAYCDELLAAFEHIATPSTSVENIQETYQPMPSVEDEFELLEKSGELSSGEDAELQAALALSRETGQDPEQSRGRDREQKWTSNSLHAPRPIKAAAFSQGNPPTKNEEQLLAEREAELDKLLSKSPPQGGSVFKWQREERQNIIAKYNQLLNSPNQQATKITPSIMASREAPRPVTPYEPMPTREETPKSRDIAWTEWKKCQQQRPPSPSL